MAMITPERDIEESLVAKLRDDLKSDANLVLARERSPNRFVPMT